MLIALTGSLILATGCSSPTVPSVTPANQSSQAQVTTLFDFSKCWGKGYDAYEKFLGKPSNTTQMEGSEIRTYKPTPDFAGKVSVVRLIVDPKFGKPGVVGVVTVITDKQAVGSCKDSLSWLGINSEGLKTTQSKAGVDRVLLLTGLKADPFVSGTVKPTDRGFDNAGDGDFSAWWQSDAHGSFLQLEIPSK